METHIVSGKHVYQPKKLSILDNAAHIYKNRLDNVDYQSFNPVTSVSSVPSSSNTTISHVMALRQEWVLPTAKPSTRFTKEQIGFLVHKFNEGEKTGHKWDPTSVAMEMKTHKVNGKLRFLPDQHLTMSQIKSYFSKLTAEKRQKAKSSFISSGPDRTRLKAGPEKSIDIKSKDDVFQLEEEIAQEDGEDNDEFDACLQASQPEQLKLEIKNLLDGSVQLQSAASPQSTNRRRSVRHFTKNPS